MWASRISIGMRATWLLESKRTSEGRSPGCANRPGSRSAAVASTTTSGAWITLRMSPRYAEGGTRVLDGLKVLVRTASDDAERGLSAAERCAIASRCGAERTAELTGHVALVVESGVDR